MQKKSPTKKNQQGLNQKFGHHHNSSAAQITRFLHALKESPISTIQARHELDIIAPAARVHELRHKHGYNILTEKRIEATPEGYEHEVAFYVLLPGKYAEGKRHD